MPSKALRGSSQRRRTRLYRGPKLTHSTIAITVSPAALPATTRPHFSPISGSNFALNASVMLTPRMNDCMSPPPGHGDENDCVRAMSGSAPKQYKCQKMMDRGHIIGVCRRAACPRRPPEWTGVHLSGHRRATARVHARPGATVNLRQLSWQARGERLEFLAALVERLPPGLSVGDVLTRADAKKDRGAYEYPPRSEGQVDIGLR